MGFFPPDELPRQLRHQVFITNQQRQALPRRQVEGARTVAGSKTVGERHGGQLGENRSERQVLTEGQQRLLVIAAYQTSLAIGEEGRVERFKIRRAELAAEAARAEGEVGTLP